MTKEEARARLRKKQSELRQAEIVMEMHENGVRELREDIAKLEEFINKKDDWKSVEVPDNIWQDLYEEKALLMADMMHFAYARNEGWKPWENPSSRKWGLSINNVEGSYFDSRFRGNSFIFGIAVKSEEIAQGMLEEFGKRIEEIYNKQY